MHWNRTGFHLSPIEGDLLWVYTSRLFNIEIQLAIETAKTMCSCYTFATIYQHWVSIARFHGSRTSGFNHSFGCRRCMVNYWKITRNSGLKSVLRQKSTRSDAMFSFPTKQSSLLGNRLSDTQYFAGCIDAGWVVQLRNSNNSRSSGLHVSVHAQ